MTLVITIFSKLIDRLIGKNQVPPDLCTFCIIFNLWPEVNQFPDETGPH